MFTFSLVTPEKKLVSKAELEEVFVPAFRGELNILPGHAPLMTTLETGILRYRLKGETTLHQVAVCWGYCHVNPQGVTVLAETAERPEEVDADRAKATLATAQQQLKVPGITPENLQKFQSKLTRAQVRLNVAQQKGTSTTTH
jgi:F-type H+-transporting ATPase subunit epsilon